jgi:putative hydrolase of the HAD superfamily
MLRAVIFDLDDTLIDWSDFSMPWTELVQMQLEPVHRWLTEQGHKVPPIAEMGAAYSDLTRSAWRSTTGPEWVSPRQIDLISQLMLTCQVDPRKLDLFGLQSRLDWDLAPGVRVFDDTHEVLQTLRAYGFKLGLLTNAAQPMWLRDRELNTLGMTAYFDYRITAGDVGRLKPHPVPFQQALDGMGISADEAIHVGDRPQDDVVGAQAAGMRAVWIRRLNSHPLGDGVRPNAIIDSLAELFDVIDRWYPGWQDWGIQQPAG